MIITILQEVRRGEDMFFSHIFSLSLEPKSSTVRSGLGLMISRGGVVTQHPPAPQWFIPSPSTSVWPMDKTYKELHAAPKNIRAVTVSRTEGAWRGRACHTRHWIKRLG